MAQAKVTRKRVKFIYDGCVGQTVAVAGSFNNWDASAHILKDKTKKGSYELSVLLPREEIMYKLVVDGEWILDSLNSNRVSDGLGGENNVLAIA